MYLGSKKTTYGQMVESFWYDIYLPFVIVVTPSVIVVTPFIFCLE